MKKNTKVILSSVAIAFLFCQPVSAEDYQSAIGLGVGMVPDYEGSEDYEAVPLLFGKFTYGNGSYVMLRGNQIKWNLFDSQIQFGPLLQYRGERDDVDNNQVDRMKDVDGAAEAGLFLTGVFGPWSATVEFAADVSGEHDGYLVTLGGDYKTHMSERLTMTFGASTTYASSNYMETYFQVDSGNRGSSTLPDYSSDSGELKDVGIHMVADYALNDRWSVMGNLGYKLLIGDAADSPIVDDEGSDGQMFFGVTGVYRF